MSWHAREAHGGAVPVENTGGPEQLLDAYFEAASGAISRNNERALQADVNVFTSSDPGSTTSVRRRLRGAASRNGDQGPATRVTPPPRAL